MEKIIRLITNGRTIHEQTKLVEQMNELAEYIGVALACTTVLAAMTIF